MPAKLSDLLGGKATISGYTQTAVLSSSQSVAVPSGTLRIEALVCGGGGGGGQGGGGFGGCALFNIPVTGAALDVVIGAGGARGANGGTSTVSSAGTLYAAVGGGGAGNGSAGAFSGGGGGGGFNGGSGGLPFTNTPLWCATDLRGTAVPGSSIANYSGASVKFVYRNGRLQDLPQLLRDQRINSAIGHCGNEVTAVVRDFKRPKHVLDK